FYFFFSSRRRHTRLQGDWSSDVCSSDLHWLMAEQEIDNGKPTVTQRDPVAHKKPLAVRTAMPNGIGHGFDLRTCWRLTAPTDDEIGRASCRERVEVWWVASFVYKDDKLV